MAHNYDFDTPPDRRNGDSYKWNRYRDRDVIPLWVADMDFSAPPPVLQALQQRLAHGVLGYAEPTASLIGAISGALFRDYQWAIEPQWLIPLPGLVCGLNVVCRAIGQAGDGVITATPIYPPFLSAPGLSERQLITVPLVQNGKDWHWDIPALEAAIAPNTRLLLLCHPHNPVGRVWSQPELEAIAAVAERYDLIVCSDEIHAGLVLEPGVKHIPFASLSPQIAERTITLMAPSKTYNLPGLGCSFAIISNPQLRRRLRQVMDGIVPHVNVLGYIACEAAYRDSEDWRLALVDYLRGNRDRVVQALDGFCGLKVTVPEATYLAWIDCRETQLKNPAQFFEQAGVGLSNGTEFGTLGFVRLNFGCSRGLLEQGLERMRAALQQRPT